MLFVAQKTRKILGFFLLTTLLLFSPIQAAAQTIPSIEGYALDTIAGFPALLKVRNASPFSSLLITIEKPNGARIVVPAKADNQGAAQVNLYDIHTHQAGTYSMTVQEAGSEAQSQTTTFTIYEDDVSQTHSSVETNTLTVKANGRDTALISVDLRDSHENPIPNHLVKLVSSRADDIIQSVSKNAYTDVAGTTVFAVSSLEPGLSTYSAVDVTAGITIEERIKIAYFDLEQNASRGGDTPTGFNPFSTNILNAQATNGPITQFAIEDIPARVQANTSLSFKVVAKDANNNTVPQYTGIVKFAVTDPNATLPPDYAFKPEDLGNHIFNLGLRLVTPGTHTISVIDTQNRDLKGSFQVIVDAGDGSVNPVSTSAPSNNFQFSYTKPIISAPTPGTYKKNTLIVSGKAGSGSQLKVFDNGKEVAQIAADQAGSFRYQLKNLSDANHQIKVGVTDGTGKVFAISDPVTVTVDSKAPSVDTVQFLPRDRVLTNGSVIIKIFSEKNLSEAAAIIDKKIIELKPDLIQDGAYTATFRAPSRTGVFPVDIIVVDALGNEGNFKAKSQLTVLSQTTLPENDPTNTGSASVASVGGTSAPNPNAPVKPGAPSKVAKVIAKESDGRVTLYWDPATDNTSVQKYKVFYGIEKDKLIVSVNTFDDNIPAWYVPNLTNGQKYYFAVAAIDSEGNTGPISDVIEGAPRAGIPHPDRNVRPDAAASTPGSSGTDAGSAAGGNEPGSNKQQTTNNEQANLGTGANGQNNALNPPGVRLGQDVPLPKRQPESGPELYFLFVPLIALAATLYTRKLRTRAARIAREPRFYSLEGKL